MPSVTLALAFVISGYIAVIRFRITGPLIKRAEGHPQYFLAVAGGAVLFALSVCVDQSIKWPASGSLSTQSLIDLFLPYFGVKQTSPEWALALHMQVETAMVSALLCVAVPFVLNLPLGSNKKLARHILAKYQLIGHLETALDHCQRREHPVMLTQESGKVYVGWVLDGAYGEEDWIRILPVFSGFRTEEQKFELKTDYLWIYELNNEEGRFEFEDCQFIEDFVICVKVNTLTGVHAFNLRTYFDRSFGPDNNEPPTLDSVNEKPTESVSVKNPSGVTPYVPDWVPQPLNWDPPYIEDHEAKRQEKIFKILYPKGRPITFNTLHIGLRSQQYFYLFYVVFVLAAPGIAAVGDRGGFSWCLGGALVCFLATFRDGRRL